MHKRRKDYNLVRCGENKAEIAYKKGRDDRNYYRGGIGCAVSSALMVAVIIVAVYIIAPAEFIRVLAEDSYAGVISDDIHVINSIKVEDGITAESVQEANEILAAGIAAELPEPLLVEKIKEPCDILVAIDPGHGGDDEGCSRDDVNEKEISLNIARAVESLLLESGYQVFLVRDGDRKMSLEERTAYANRKGADIYISIHQNACEEKTSDVSGVEVWYNDTKPNAGSERLAKLIHNDLVLYTGANDRGVISDESLYVIRETNMPACLVETGFLSNKKERELLCTEEYQAKVAEGIVSGIELYFFPKSMYLTFDDGPSAENTEKVLDILAEHDIKATFFLVGENVEKHPEVAKRIAKEGHTIGIHCYSHEYKMLYENVDNYVEDFEKAHSIVYETTGVDAKIFRFPGGSINSYNKAVYKDIIEEMTERGYIYYDWNASLEDATKHNEPERLLKNAKESTFGRKRVIMLAHDVVYNTTQCLEELLDMFPEYEMLPLDENVEPVQF